MRPRRREVIGLGELRGLAEALGAPGAGARLVASLRERMAAVESTGRRLASRPRVASIEWIESLMAGGNWMPDLVAMAVSASLFGKAGKHSPWLDWDDLRAADPDVVFVSPCGFDVPVRAATSHFTMRPSSHHRAA